MTTADAIARLLAGMPYVLSGPKADAANAEWIAAHRDEWLAALGGRWWFTNDGETTKQNDYGVSPLNDVSCWLFPLGGGTEQDV